MLSRCAGFSASAGLSSLSFRKAPGDNEKRYGLATRKMVWAGGDDSRYQSRFFIATFPEGRGLDRDKPLDLSGKN